MDYNECWDELKDQLIDLIQLGVRSIDPEIVVAFMRFIEEKEQYREKLKSRNTDATA